MHNIYKFLINERDIRLDKSLDLFIVDGCDANAVDVCLLLVKQNLSTTLVQLTNTLE